MEGMLILALSCYVTGSAGYVGYLLAHKEAAHTFGHAFFLAGVLCHTLVLGISFAVTGHLPVENLRESLGFLAWAVALVFVAFQARYNLKVLGALAGPVVFVALIISLALPPEAHAEPELLKSIWMFFHISAIFLGDGAFVLAALVGGIYLLQERAIKSKSHGFFFQRLPSLQRLDSMGYALVAFGFPLLTIGMITGFIYAQTVWGRWWSWDPKEVWSLVTWLIYAALLHGRMVKGWQGRRTAIIALIGLFVVLFTFLGVNLLLPGHHGQFAIF
jgi:cytochrome c-type biogenesis protein CcsB